jgi:hypothetical protein
VAVLVEVHDRPDRPDRLASLPALRDHSLSEAWDHLVPPSTGWIDHLGVAAACQVAPVESVSSRATAGGSPERRTQAVRRLHRQWALMQDKALVAGSLV